jgi:hypothetical protein
MGFLIWAALKRGIYKNWILFAAGIALLIGTSVSGSRSVVGACAVVVLSLIVVLFVHPSAINRFGQTLLVTVVLGFVVIQLPIFKEGLNVLTTRFADVAEAEDRSVTAGLIQRASDTFSEGFLYITKAPFLGYGLGIGTNAGAKFLTGRTTFLLSEGEWARIILESGPVLGLAYLIWRCGVVVRIGLLCLRSIMRNNVLPLLLFSSAFLPMISGQFGQPTILGFAVFAMGLALAARHQDEESVTPPPFPGRGAGMGERVTGRRSPYADRMHGPTARPDHRNGSTDR